MPKKSKQLFTDTRPQKVKLILKYHCTPLKFHYFHYFFITKKRNFPDYFSYSLFEIEMLEAVHVKKKNESIFLMYTLNFRMHEELCIVILAAVTVLVFTLLMLWKCL